MQHPETIADYPPSRSKTGGYAAIKGSGAAIQLNYLNHKKSVESLKHFWEGPQNESGKNVRLQEFYMSCPSNYSIQVPSLQRYVNINIGPHK